PAVVCVCELQLRTRQRGQVSKGGGKAWPRSEQVVQQRGARCCGKDRDRDDDLRPQHLQVLRRVQADARCTGRSREGTAASGTEEGLTRRARCRVTRRRLYGSLEGVYNPDRSWTAVKVVL